MASTFGATTTTDGGRATGNGFSSNRKGGNIWAAAPIGTGKGNTSRASSRPPPLMNTTHSSDGLLSSGDLATPNLTGSGSLLGSSQADGWGRGWPQLGSAGGLSNGRGPMLNGVSAAASRTNQRTRDNSPFRIGQHSAIGTAPISGPGSARLLDPTTNDFAPRGLDTFNSTFSPNSDLESMSRRQVNSSTFQNSYDTQSGYASSAASRNGSLPPSRHGMDPPAPFNDFGFSNPASAEAFMHRPNQHSRNSNYSINGPGNRQYLSSAWQHGMNELNNNMSRIDLGRNNQDRPGSSPWESTYNNSSPGSVNGNLSYQRAGSLSLEPGSSLSDPTSFAFGQQRFNLGQGSSYSPTGSDSRQEADSPFDPVPNQWQQDISSRNSRTNLNSYGGNYALNQYHLEGALQHFNNSQSYQPSPALSHQSLYNGHTRTGASTPNYRVQNQYSGQQMHYANAYNGRVPPRAPAAEEKKGSPFLQDFHMSKNSNRKFELKDVYGYVVEFSGDQHGSRFLQTKLETANSDDKAQVFQEILPNAVPLMTDLFGNYVIQKFFEHGNQQQKKELADTMRGKLRYLSTQMYACRVVQKALEVVLVEQQASLIQELKDSVIHCVKDQNGNHVIQKAIESIPSRHITFITGAFTGQVHHLAVHNYGCRVIQRMLESSHEPAKTQILDELQHCVQNLIVDQFGNYVTQNIVKHGRDSDRDKVIAIVTSNLVAYATQKYASNVVEVAFMHGSYEQRQRMIGVATSMDVKGESTAVRLMRDQFGNYIIQTFIKHLQKINSKDEYENFVDLLRPQLEKLKTISYGKQVGSIEKLILNPPLVDTTQSDGLGPLEIRPVHTPALTNEDAQSPRSSSHPSTSHSTIDDAGNEVVVDTPQKPTISVIQVAAEGLSEQVTPTEA